VPCDVKVWLVCAVPFQPGAIANGVVEVSVTRYPVTPTLSVAENDVIGTVSEVEVDGIVKAVTVGGEVSPAGLLPGLPGNVPALISIMLEKVSPSESCDSMFLKLNPAFL